jgi:transposase
MLGCINKTDKLDVHGLNRLQRTGTLPTVWLPPAAIRDQRDLPRVRMFLVQERGRLKNRIHAQLAKYGVLVTGHSDLFGVGGLKALRQEIDRLPPCAREVTRELLAQLEFVEEQIAREERRIMEVVRETPDMVRLMTLPGVGKILAIVIALEIGAISRFRSAEHCAAYAGTTPRIHASGDKIRRGKMRSDVNRYLKWAFMEAANSVCRHKARLPYRHVTQLYARIKNRKGHGQAIGAVARHLAEATFYMLSKGEDYKEPNFKHSGLIQRNVSAE